MPHKMKKAVLVTTIWLAAFLALGVLATIGGCARVPATATTPGRTATPFENVLAWNAAIANANLAVVQGTINANRSNALTDAETTKMLDTAAEIATANRQLTLIFQAGPAATKTAAQTVKGLLDQIKFSGGQLVMLGAVGIKNQNTQTAVKAQLDAILTFGQQIADALVLAGIL